MMEPSACANMDELRAEIDRIDGGLVDLLVRRAACIDRAVQIKRGAGLPSRIEWRVAEVIAKVESAAAGRGLDPVLVAEIWERIVEWSIAREARALGEEEGG
jgi:isochorismate pyruvate lyase